MEQQATRGAWDEVLPAPWVDFLGPKGQAILAPILDRLAHEGDYFPRSKVFRAFELCPPSQVKVCVVGQDPYHGPGQAHGLAFSVPVGVGIPPSLRNLFKELNQDLGVECPAGAGDLSSWARQGVLLLNAILTVKPHQPASHADLGWQAWTDYVLAKLGAQKPSPVFVLWGGFAKKKQALLGPDALVVVGGHPSPLSANRGGFFGGRYFSKVNAMLSQSGRAPVDWSLAAPENQCRASPETAASMAEGNASQM